MTTAKIIKTGAFLLSIVLTGQAAAACANSTNNGWEKVTILSHTELENYETRQIVRAVFIEGEALPYLLEEADENGVLKSNITKCSVVKNEQTGVWQIQSQLVEDDAVENPTLRKITAIKGC